MAEAVQLSVAEIKSALEHDAEFFIQFFLEDELTWEVPTFHKDIFYLMTLLNIKRFVCAIPRDHAKTTLAKLAAVWYLLFSDYRFIVYISNTLTIAVPATNDIINFLESENCKAVFGEIQWIKKQDGVGFYQFVLNGKLCILRAMGAGQQVRGINVDNQRPQLAILDDIEDNDNIATPELFRKLKVWFYGPFRKALDKRHNKIIHLGNMISATSLLNEHCESEYWHSRRYGAILSNWQPLWPDAWSIEALRTDFREYCENGMADIWFAEMMNLPLASGQGLIKAQDITYRPVVLPGDIEYGFITVDLALSDRNWAHKTCVSVHGWTGELWQIVEYHLFKGIDPIKLFWVIVSMCAKWRLHVIGIESVAYQASLQFVYPYIALEKEIENLTFVPLPAVQQKTQRLATWAGLLKTQQYALTEGDYTLTQQLLTYDPLKKTNDDDGIDACAHGPRMYQEFLFEIMERVNPSLPAEIKTLYSISAI